MSRGVRRQRPPRWRRRGTNRFPDAFFGVLRLEALEGPFCGLGIFEVAQVLC